MKYHELTTNSPRVKKRVGRGIAAGQGKTAGRGTKGQKSRTGYSKRPGFEGGQNPLMQLVPKLRGFNSHKVRAEVIYTGQLDRLAGKTVDNQALSEGGLITNPYVGVKLLAKGNVTKKVSVKLQNASAGAIKQVEKAGGSFEKVARASRPKTKKEETKK
jgi:large subunit ribosomal protein L15